MEHPLDPDDDEDDDVLLVAVYEAEKSLQTEAAVAQDDDDMVAAVAQDDDDMVAAVAQDDDDMVAAMAASSSSSQLHPDLPGFDGSSAGVWIYPTNYPVREYQLRISEAALFRNTLVCLPTGLGKTFIASVVMYNFYRWYPSGKIVFMAPTKPLVAQQIEACYKVMGIPQTHMAELTGMRMTH